jgi:hypothetical protein
MVLVFPYRFRVFVFFFRVYSFWVFFFIGFRV